MNQTGMTPPADQFLSLAQILNILWRRKMMILLMTLLGLAAGIVYGIVTPPLYRATATVRPGITNFNANGNPERAWHLKDIVRWYKSGLYADGVREALGWESTVRAPIIQAEFIPRGVGVQGGDVVTLTLMHVDGPEAKQILDTTVDAFNSYAEINSVGSSISLARSSLQSQIDKLANDREDVEVKKALLDIEIERTRNELRQVEVEEQALELKIAEHEATQTSRARKAGALEEGVSETETELGEMDHILDRMEIKQERQDVRDSLMTMAPPLDTASYPWWEMAEDKTATTGRLLLSTLNLQRSIWQQRVQAVELRSEVEIAELAHRAELLTQSFDLANRRKLVELTIREQEIRRDRALAQEIVNIEDDIKLIQSQLVVLTSLEKIGVNQVTDNPVRPRKSRAAGLLTLAGLIGSIGLAFVVEYGSLNRQVIFAGQGHGD